MGDALIESAVLASPKRGKQGQFGQGLDPLGTTKSVDGVKDDIGSVVKVQLLVELLSELMEFVVHVTIIESSSASFKSEVSLSNHM